MIDKLRRRFILASMLSLALVLLILLGAVNIVSYQKTVADADGILSLLSENQGAFPIHMFPNRERMPDERPMRRREFSPETPFESRFFSVLLREDGSVLFADLANIAAIDRTTAEKYAAEALSTGKESGFLDVYRFSLKSQPEGTRIIFLDCAKSLSAFQTTLLASIGVAVAGLAGVLMLLIPISGKIVKPVAESYEKQRRFITDAGHEIKTPLTIISADADLLELEAGESEWLEDIRRQTQRLTALTNDLIYLSRMDEEQPTLQMMEFPLSDVVEETAQSFLAPATQQGKHLTINVQPMLSYTGSEKDLRQLVSILLDNAVKYTPAGGEIALSLAKENHTLCLRVTNPSSQQLDKESLSRMFDRFYRMDASRSAAVNGYGLGLSIARSIVAAHKGKLLAESLDGINLTITASFPTK